MGGSQSRSGICGYQKNLTSAGNRTPVVQPVDRPYTEPFRLKPEPGTSQIRSKPRHSGYKGLSSVHDRELTSRREVFTGPNHDILQYGG
jgi:hypothetical protein